MRTPYWAVEVQMGLPLFVRDTWRIFCWVGVGVTFLRIFGRGRKETRVARPPIPFEHTLKPFEAHSHEVLITARLWHAQEYLEGFLDECLGLNTSPIEKRRRKSHFKSQRYGFLTPAVQASWEARGICFP